MCGNFQGRNLTGLGQWLWPKQLNQWNFFCSKLAAASFGDLLQVRMFQSKTWSGYLPFVNSKFKLYVLLVVSIFLQFGLKNIPLRMLYPFNNFSTLLYLADYSSIYCFQNKFIPLISVKLWVRCADFLITCSMYQFCSPTKFLCATYRNLYCYNL